MSLVCFLWPGTSTLSRLSTRTSAVAMRATILSMMSKRFMALILGSMISQSASAALVGRTAAELPFGNPAAAAANAPDEVWQ